MKSNYLSFTFMLQSIEMQKETTKMNVDTFTNLSYFIFRCRVKSWKVLVPQRPKNFG